MAKKRRGSQGSKSRSNGSSNGSSNGHRGPAEGSQRIRREVPTGAGASVLPPTFGSLGRAIKVVVTDPVLIAVPLLLVASVWFVLLAVGLRFLPPPMPMMLALSPIGSNFDVQVGSALFSFTMAGLGWIIFLTVIRALVTAVLVGLIDESITYGRVSLAGLFRGLQAFGAVLIYEYFCIMAALISGIIAPSLGQSLGTIAGLAMPVAVLFFLSMTPFVAVRERVGGAEASRRSIRAARLPGWPRLLATCALLFFLMNVLRPIVQVGALEITAAPPLLTWVWAFGGAMVSAFFLTAIGLYWRAAEPYVGPQKPQRRSVATARRR